MKNVHIDPDISVITINLSKNSIFIKIPLDVMLSIPVEKEKGFKMKDYIIGFIF